MSEEEEKVIEMLLFTFYHVKWVVPQMVRNLR
jgi:hypothetical protein